MSDDVEAVEIRATIPKTLADALCEVHDRRISNLSSGRRRGWDSEELTSRDDDLSPGVKIVKLSINGNIQQREIKRAIQKERADDDPSGLRYV